MKLVHPSMIILLIAHISHSADTPPNPPNSPANFEPISPKKITGLYLKSMREKNTEEEKMPLVPILQPKPPYPKAIDIAAFFNKMLINPHQRIMAHAYTFALREECSDAKATLPTRILVIGPVGAGKTSHIKRFAECLNCKILCISCEELIKTIRDEARDGGELALLLNKMSTLYQEARALGERDNASGAVLHLQEPIELIALTEKGNTVGETVFKQMARETEFTSHHRAKKLAQYSQSIPDYSGQLLIVIGETNTHPTEWMRDNFQEIVEFEYPDEVDRKRYMRKQFKHKNVVVEDKLLSEGLIDQTDKLSYTALAKICDDATIFAVKAHNEGEAATRIVTKELLKKAIATYRKDRKIPYGQPADSSNNNPSSSMSMYG